MGSISSSFDSIKSGISGIYDACRHVTKNIGSSSFRQFPPYSYDHQGIYVCLETVDSIFGYKFFHCCILANNKRYELWPINSIRETKLAYNSDLAGAECRLCINDQTKRLRRNCFWYMHIPCSQEKFIKRFKTFMEKDGEPITYIWGFSPPEANSQTIICEIIYEKRILLQRTDNDDL